MFVIFQSDPIMRAFCLILDRMLWLIWLKTGGAHLATLQTFTTCAASWLAAQRYGATGNGGCNRGPN